MRGATIQDLTLAGNSALSNSLDAAGIVAIVDAGGKTSLSGLVNQTAAVSGACPGGIVGRVYGDETLIADCRNEGPIAIAADGKGGGIVGQLDVAQSATLTGCANTATVACPALPAVGGVAGACVHGDLIRCTNAAAVTGGNYAGGVAGRFGTGRLNRCAGGVGDVAAAKAAGRLVGLVSNGPKGMATFAIDDANGDAHSAALGSIGRVVDDTAGPAWGLATVEAGRLIGTPSLGNNTAAIRFAGPGKWAQKPGFLDYFAYPVLEGEAGHWQQEAGELTESERRVAQVETCFTIWTRQRQDDGAYAWGRAGAFIPASETRNATFGDAAALLRGLQAGETLFLAAPATLTNLDIPEGAFLDLNHHALTLIGQPTAGSLERLIPHADPTTAIDRSDLDGEGNYIDNRGNPTETPVPMPRRAWKMVAHRDGPAPPSAHAPARLEDGLRLRRRRVVPLRRGRGGGDGAPEPQARAAHRAGRRQPCHAPHHRALRPGQRRARGNRAQPHLHLRQDRRWVGLLRLRRRLPSP